MDKALYKQTGAAPHSQAWCSWGLPITLVSYEGNNKAEHLQPKKFLECIDEIFFLQVTEELT